MKPILDAKKKVPKVPLKDMGTNLHLPPLPTVYLPKDVSRRDSSVSFLHAKNLLHELDEQLASKRVRCLEIMDILNAEWINLEQRENHFRNMIVLHNKFVKNNMEKRSRANMRYEQQHHLFETRIKNLDNLKEEMKIAQFLVAEFRIEISKHEIYDIFLNQVADVEDSPCKSINEILTRYEILKLVRERRLEDQLVESNRVIEVHQDMKAMVDSRNVVLVGLRNDLNNLRCKFEDICRKNLATESLITSIVNRTNQLSSEVSSCQYMIDAIYRYICQRRKIPQADFALNDVQAKIDVLKSTLGAWEKILAMPELTRRKKSLKYGRKSYKGSIAQPLFLWRKKASMLAELAAGVGEKLDKM